MSSHDDDGPTITEDEIARAQSAAEILLKQLSSALTDRQQHEEDENNEQDQLLPLSAADIAAAETILADARAEIEGMLAQLAASQQAFSSNSDKTKSLLTELDAAQRTLADLRTEEEDLTANAKATQEESAKLAAETEKAKGLIHATQKTLADKKAHIAKLETLQALGSGWTDDQTRQREELDAQRGIAQVQLDGKRGQLTTLRGEVAMLTSHVERAQLEKNTADKKVAELKDSIANHRTAAAALTRTKESRDRALLEGQQNIARLTTELAERTLQTESGGKEVLAAQEALKADRQMLDRYVKEYERLQAKAQRLTEEIDEAMRQNQAKAAEIEEINGNTASFRTDEAKARRERGKVEKLQQIALEKIKETEHKISEAETRVSALQAEAEQLDKEVIAEQRRLDLKKQAVTDAGREKEVLAKGLARQGDKAKGALAAVSFQEGVKKQLESEIGGYIQTMRRLRGDIEDLQAARQRLAGELETAAQSYFTAAEGVKLQELQIAALQRKVEEGEKRLVQQQSLYEAVKTDRNAYSKQLVAAHSELAEMKTDFKTLSRRIEGLKEEIMSKDQSLVKRHFEHHRIEKEKDSLRNEVQRVQKQVQACEHIGSNQETEIKKLTAIVAEAEAEFARQKKELEAVQAERQLITQQLHKRDAELKEVYEKLQVQKSMLANGAAAFAKRAAERDALASKIAARKGELLLATTQLSDTSALEKECAKLEEDLRAEKGKIRALTEELERPINVHRWRALQDRNPTKWALLQRVHEVQRRLLEVRDSIKQREDDIKSAQAEHDRLKNHLAKAPAAELGDAIGTYQAALKEKARQIKGMEADVEAARVQVDDYKRELSRLDEVMRKMNDEWVRRMRGQGGGQATATMGEGKRRRNTTAVGGMMLSSVAAAAAGGGGGWGDAGSLNRSMDDSLELGGKQWHKAGGGGGGTSAAAAAAQVNAEADRVLAQYAAEERKKAESEGKGE